jgi:hypothetical protein
MTSQFSEIFLRTTRHHAGWAAQQLQGFTEFLPGGDWNADLDACWFQQAGRTLRVGMLGTYDVNDHSWLWGWANPGFADKPVSGAAGALREYGQRYGVPEFTAARLDLAGFADPRRSVEMLVFGAMAVLGAPGYVGVRASPDARLYLVPNDPQVPWVPFDAVALPRVLLTAVDLMGGGCAREVASGYFTRHGLAFQQSSDALRATLPNGSVAVVGVDELDRIAAVSVQAGPANASSQPGH